MYVPTKACYVLVVFVSAPFAFCCCFHRPPCFYHSFSSPNIATLGLGILFLRCLCGRAAGSKPLLSKPPLPSSFMFPFVSLPPFLLLFL